MATARLSAQSGCATEEAIRCAPAFDFIHVAVNDATRLAFVQVLADDKGLNTARFLVDAAAFFASYDIRVERVLTDNAFTYRLNPRFTAAVSQLGARHKLTRSYRPQTNGKAERFIQILLREWAYAVPYSSNDERLATLPAWVDDYNRHRSHGGLAGLTPMQVLVNKAAGNYN